jgi:1-phosphofructokinase
MIVTVTPNPSVDRTVFIDSLRRGAVLRSQRGWSEPSGKGVNVALALARHGCRAAAVLPVGGPGGAHLTEMLRHFGLAYRAVPVAGHVRINVSLVEPDGTVTKINESGPVLTPAEVEALVATSLEATSGSTWLAGCGSLPGGVEADFYARLVTEGRRHGGRIAVDTSGPSLLEALAAKPDLIKPNRDELAEAVGTRPRTLGEAVEAARELRALGAGAVLASLGADGVLLVDEDGVLHGTARVERVVSTVGAGDALLSGFLAGGGRGRDALALGLRWAAAAVQHQGTLFTSTGPSVIEPEVVVNDHFPDGAALADD